MIKRKKIKEALKDSAEHWKRMINFVKTLNLEELPDRTFMLVEIRENWTGEFCHLCDLFQTCGAGIKCKSCPLSIIGEDCSYSNTGSLWQNIAGCDTWKEWLEYANEMLIILEELYKRW
jgi:hypothetical protein